MTLVKQNFKSLDQVFDELFQHGAVVSPNRNSFHIPVNIFENEESFSIDIIVPGMNKENFKINSENGLLTVSAETEKNVSNDNKKILRREYAFSDFKRTFTVDKKIDTDKIEAKYESGVLKLTLPKKEEAKKISKEITIQ